MRIAQILQSLSSTCRYCGQQTGLLKRDHPECRQAHQAGHKEMVQLAAQAAAAHSFNEAALRQILQAIALCALGHRLVEAGHSVLFAPPPGPAYRLVQELLAAKRDLDLPRRLRKLDNFDFLLLDDLGYLPQGAEESEVLFTLIAERRAQIAGHHVKSGLLGVGAHLCQPHGHRRGHRPGGHHSVILEFDVPATGRCPADRLGITSNATGLPQAPLGGVALRAVVP